MPRLLPRLHRRFGPTERAHDVTGDPAQPPIPRQRADIAAEAKRCANSRANHQNRLLDELIAIDALTRRLDDLIEAMSTAPA